MCVMKYTYLLSIIYFLFISIIIAHVHCTCTFCVNPLLYFIALCNIISIVVPLVQDMVVVHIGESIINTRLYM
jgi:hypothetical protein